MDESQPKGVQHLPGGRIACQVLQSLVLALSVSRVTRQRETQELEVHPDLVSAASVKQRFDERRAIQAVPHLVSSSGFAAFLAIHRHPFPMRRMPRDCSADFSALPRQLSANDR